MSKAREEAVGKDGKIGRRRKNGANGTRQRAGNDSRIGQFKRSAELEAAIQRFSDLYEFAPVGYITFDRTGRIKQINLAAAELIGIRRESLIGAPFTLYVAREDMSLLLNHLVRCRSGERRVETNIHLKKQTGALTSVFLCSTPTSLLEEGAQLFQTAIVDVTERERAEEALRAKEVELEQIVTQTPFMLVRCTRDLRFRYVSHAYAKMVGLTSEEIAGKRRVHDEDGEGGRHGKGNHEPRRTGSHASIVAPLAARERSSSR